MNDGIYLDLAAALEEADAIADALGERYFSELSELSEEQLLRIKGMARQNSALYAVLVERLFKARETLDELQDAESMDTKRWMACFNFVREIGIDQAKWATELYNGIMSLNASEWEEYKRILPTLGEVRKDQADAIVDVMERARAHRSEAL